MTTYPHLVLVGGFLGAGKTSLIVAAATELGKLGLRSAVILNDQSESLVDTKMARASRLAADEVTGGCFCCRFSELVEAAGRLRQFNPDVIFAEPVGSCTDISATVLRPFQLTCHDTYRLAPYSVLVDPVRARELSAPDADPDMHFLFSSQITEADLLCFTKSDLYPDPPQVTHKRVRQLSARSGQGVRAWLDEILSGVVPAAEHILTVDYKQYAQAEAALTWLNLNATLELAIPASPAMLLGPLMEGIDRNLGQSRARIIHLKASSQCDAGFLKAAQCGNGVEPDVEGALDASPALRHELCLNLRALGEPEVIRAVVERQFETIAGTASHYRLTCFRPAAPVPERRIRPA